MQQVRKAAEAGAVKTLLVSDDFVAKLRKKNKYSEFEQLVEGSKGEIHIISTDNEAGKN